MGSEEHRGGEERDRRLFNECPAALWEADLSALVGALESLREGGVADLHACLTQRPEEAVRLAGLIRIVGVNKAALRLFEAPDEETLRAGLAAVFTRESFATFRDVVAAVARGDRISAAESVARTLGGKMLRIGMKWSILPDEAGRPTRLLLSTEEITAAGATEERLKESEDRFRSIFERACDGMMMLEVGTKRQVEANAAICAMLGYSREEILGLPFDALHPAGALPLVRDAIERQIRGETPLAADIPMLRKDGSVFHADVNSVPLTLHGRQYLLGVFRDCTGRRKAEQEIRESRQRLEAVIETAPT